MLLIYIETAESNAKPDSQEESPKRSDADTNQVVEESGPDVEEVIEAIEESKQLPGEKEENKTGMLASATRTSPYIILEPAESRPALLLIPERDQCS